MHPSVLRTTRRLVDTYVPKNVSLTVVDVGSRQVANQQQSHRELFDLTCCRYIGVDVVDGPNVDAVLKEPYTLPFDDDSVDVVICGQVFEHIPFFWTTMLEFARVTRTDGFIVLSAPSRGHVHSPPFDGWRFYEQGFRALADFADLRCIEVVTDYPPSNESTRRFDYSGIASDRYTDTYWGDTVGIFQKTHLHRPELVNPVRDVLRDWSNRLAGSASSPGAPTATLPATIRTTLGRGRRTARRTAGRFRAKIRR